MQKKLLRYIAKIDMIWFTIWGTIFVSFVVLDSIFQTAYPNENVFYSVNLFGRDILIKVVENGTFIGVTLLKYIGIVLSFVYAHKKFPKDHILQIALGFTLLADTILTFDQVNVFGVLAFCFAQYFHTARFAHLQPKAFVAWSLLILLVFMFGFFNGVPTMYILALIYATSLFMNIALTRRFLKLVKKEKRPTARDLVASGCAFYGFTLFALCDINVALSYLSVTAVLPLFLARYANFFAWLFYYPSQVLISNSSIKGLKLKKSHKKLPR